MRKFLCCYAIPENVQFQQNFQYYIVYFVYFKYDMMECKQN